MFSTEFSKNSNMKLNDSIHWDPSRFMRAGGRRIDRYDEAK